MACCALAAFIVSQLLVALDWARERFGLAAVASAPSASAAWRLGDAMRSPAVPRRTAPRRLALALSGGALAFAFTWAALGVRGAHEPHALQLPYLCTSGAPLLVD